VLGKTANWSELAKDCIAFANALGGTLLVGFMDPTLLRNLQFAGEITLKRIEPHRLVALVLEELTAKGDVRFEGDKRWRRYWMVQR
jgi:predicted HTH transcriptional regulator